MARSASRTARKPSNIITVDFDGVEGKRPRLTPGEYLAKVDELTREKGDKGDYLKWVFSVTEGKAEGAKLYYNTSLTKQSLWNLRGLLEALGQEVPDSELDIDMDELLELPITLVVDDEEYNGKQQSRVVDFMPAEEPEPEEKPKRGSKKKSAAKEEEEEEAPARRGSKAGKASKKKPKLSQDEINDMGQDELQEVVDTYELEDVDLDKLKVLRKMKAAVIDALEQAELLAE